jgi:hypothetical protein
MSQVLLGVQSLDLTAELGSELIVVICELLTLVLVSSDKAGHSLEMAISDHLTLFFNTLEQLHTLVAVLLAE